MFFVIGGIWILVISVVFWNASIFVVGMLALLFAYNLLRAYDHDGVLRWISTVALSVGLLAMLVIYFGLQSKYGAPYYYGGSDDRQFEVVAQDLVSRNVYFPKQMPVYYSGHNSKGFVCMLAALMRVCNLFGGYHTVTPRIVNIILLIVLGLEVFHLVILRTGNAQIAKRAFSFIVFFPNSIYLSSFVFRDTVNIVLLLFCVVVCCEFLKSHNLGKAVVVTVLCSYLCFWLRAQNLMIIGATIGIFLFIGQKGISAKRLLILLIPFLLGLFVLSRLDVLGSILEINSRYTTNYFSYSNNGLSRIVFSVPLFPFGIILRMLYAIVSPIPTGIMQIMNLFDIDAFAAFCVSCGTVYQIYQLPYLVKGMLKFDDISVEFLLMWFIISATTFTFRHFIMLYPFMAYIVEKEKAEVKKRYTALITVVIVALGLLYVGLSL